MEVYSTEEQQVEAIKKFWQENGTQIILGAAIGLAGFGGWKWYVNSQIEAQEAASADYDKFIELAQKEATTAEATSAELDKFVTAHGDTGYAIFAQLVAAKKSVDAGQFDAALASLKSAEQQTTDSALKGLVSIRVARVQMQLEQYDAAIATLNSIENSGYEARVAELKGDVYSAQGNLDKARVEYQSAVDKGGVEGNALLKMKLDDLALSANVAG
jgi:predicted negative regulator of RcsB-dependent stress response